MPMSIKYINPTYLGDCKHKSKIAIGPICPLICVRMKNHGDLKYQKGDFSDVSIENFSQTWQNIRNKLQIFKQLLKMNYLSRIQAIT